MSHRCHHQKSDQETDRTHKQEQNLTPVTSADECGIQIWHGHYQCLQTDELNTNTAISTAKPTVHTPENHSTPECPNPTWVSWGKNTRPTAVAEASWTRPVDMLWMLDQDLNETHSMIVMYCIRIYRYIHKMAVI